MLALMQDVADQVITPRFRRLASGEVIEKNPGDLVTVADREAEVLITQALRATDPDTIVVGEEATAADPALLDRLQDAPHAYVVDPVDGTKNFVHGRADYAVMVAELRDGICVRGWIWQPEYSAAYIAIRGKGLTCNGAPVTRSAPSLDPDELRAVTSRPEHEGRHGRLVVGPTAWCCGVDYPWLAQGRVDAITYSRAMPWDHAAGSLMTEEVGGVVRHIDGTTYRPGRRHPGHLLAAASAEAWDVVKAELG